MERERVRASATAGRTSRGASPWGGSRRARRSRGDRAEDGIARAHAPKGMLSVKNCVHAAAPAKPSDP